MSLRGEIYGSTIYTRSEWGARPPRSTSGIPAVEMVTVHYAGPSDWGSSADRSSPAAFQASTNHARCDDIMRSHQNFHMDTRGWSDYAYNGSACPHGFGFIGRGRGVRSAAQGTTDGNNRSYAIQYTGAGVHGGREDPLTEAAKRAFYDMAAYLNEPLRRGHRDWKSTSCPGEPTYAWRRAGFPRPSGGGQPPPPTQDWLDMASEAEVRQIVRGEIYRFAEWLTTGAPNQVYPDAEPWAGAIDLSKVWNELGKSKAVDAEVLAQLDSIEAKVTVPPVPPS